MARVLQGFATLLLLFQTSLAVGAEANDIAPRIQLKSELLEVSLTQLEQVYGHKLEWAAREPVPQERLREIVATTAAPLIDQQPLDWLASFKKHNVAKRLARAEREIASGKTATLGEFGVEGLPKEGKLKIDVGPRIEMFAKVNAKRRIEYDGQVSFTQTQRGDGQQPVAIKRSQWLVGGEVASGEMIVWMGPLASQTVAVERENAEGEREVVERINLVGTLLVLTPEIVEPAEESAKK